MTFMNGIRTAGIVRICQYRKGRVSTNTHMKTNDPCEKTVEQKSKSEAFLEDTTKPSCECFCVVLFFYCCTSADKEAGLVKTAVAVVNWTSTDREQTPTGAEFTYLHGESEMTVWPAGVPSDGTPIEVQHYPLLPLMVLVYLFAATGLAITIICLVFNVVFRNRKLVVVVIHTH